MFRPGKLLSTQPTACRAAYWCRLIVASHSGSPPRLVRFGTLSLWQGPEGVGPSRELVSSGRVVRLAISEMHSSSDG